MSHTGPNRRFLLIALVGATLLYTTSARAGDTDSHLSHDGTGALFQHSVFAHGYIHGYEEGFHWGNLDFQTGRPVSRGHEARAAKSSYERTFGGRGRFKAGYHRGFLAGYHDGFSGREFRAHEMAKVAAKDLPETPHDAKQLTTFDSGVSDGYDLGAIHGQNASRDDDDFDATTELCTAGTKEHASHPPLYCAGFRRGYTMGYSDGYLGHGADSAQTTTSAKR